MIYSRTWADSALGVTARQMGERAAARCHFERALADREGLDDCLTAIVLGHLAALAEAEGNRRDARRLLQRARLAAAERGEMQIPDFIAQYVELELRWGNTEHAAALAKEALVRAHRGREKGRMARFIFALARIASTEGDLCRAARLFAVAARIRDEMGYVLSPSEESEQTAALARIQSELGDAASDAWDAGEALSVDEAVAFAACT